MTETIGWVVILAVILGALNMIDVRVCVGPVGYCNPPGTERLEVRMKPILEAAQ